MAIMVELILGIGSILVALSVFIHSLYRAKAEKKRLTLSLHEKYHSPEFYSRIRSEVWQMNIKWFHITDENERRQFRESVITGWIGYNKGSDNDILARQVKDRDSNCNKDYPSYHHKVERIAFGLTEHEVLTIFLEFWTDINQLRKHKMINSILLYSLFKEKLNYDMNFIRSLISGIEERISYEGQGTLPAWVSNIRELDIFFNSTGKESSQL